MPMQTSKMSSPQKGALLGLGVFIALLTFASGCSCVDSSSSTTTTTTTKESSSLGGTAVAKVLETSTKAVLVDQKITLDGDLKCTADISLIQGTVAGSCAGTDTDGNAIASTLDGEASVTGVNRCSGTFKVTRGTEVINENKKLNCI